MYAVINEDIKGDFVMHVTLYKMIKKRSKGQKFDITRKNQKISGTSLRKRCVFKVIFFLGNRF